jgi:hypothetical protein
VLEPVEPAGTPEPAGALTPLEWERTLREQLGTGGLWTRDTLGPDYTRLRPYGPRTTPGFPVHPNLEERLLHPRRQPDPVIAHVLAACAAYAYAGTETVSMIMARLGLEENRCRMITSSVDAMFIRSTAFLIQSRSGRVAVLCYRGTEPADFVGWMTDADVVPERMSYRARRFLQQRTGHPVRGGGGAETRVRGPFGPRAAARRRRRPRAATGPP